MSILKGLDSEVRELRVELGGHSFIPRIDRPLSQRTIYVKDRLSIVDYVIFNHGVGTRGKTTSASYLNQKVSPKHLRNNLQMAVVVYSTDTAQGACSGSPQLEGT